MAQAVASAAQLATSGDTVLLAPAAASMDQFSSYAHRGDAFIEAVRELWKGRPRPARSNNGQHAHPYDGGQARRRPRPAARPAAQAARDKPAGQRRPGGTPARASGSGRTRWPAPRWYRASGPRWKARASPATAPRTT